MPVPASTSYQEAIADAALRWACADRVEDLRLFFARAELEFDQALVHDRQGKRCHIFYEPTLRGFRALPEDAPVSELFLNVDTLAFLSQRELVVGDSLDVARTMLPLLKRPIQVMFGLSTQYPKRYYKAALKKYFPDSPHRFQFQDNAAEEYSPWVQDFLKSGSAGEEEKVLITRQAYEGNAEIGKALQPMLRSFQSERFVHGKLSFEGGDLVFARDPRTPQRLLLFHGTAGKAYWGEALSGAEFAYVLRLEFGADESIYMGDAAPHVDYTLAVLASENVVLVAKPACGDIAVARDAFDLLEAAYRNPTPAELTELGVLLETKRAWKEPGRNRILEALRHAEAAQSSWRVLSNPEVAARIESYAALHCPHQPRACVDSSQIPQLLSNHMRLLEDWVEMAARLRTQEVLSRRLLSIVHRQASGCDAKAEQKLEMDARMLEQRGFHVIRVPSIEGMDESGSLWPGISYVNAALMDRLLFVPQLGLRRVESRWMSELAKELPEGFQVVPVPARFLVLRNGGIHCALAFGRTAQP